MIDHKYIDFVTNSEIYNDYIRNGNITELDDCIDSLIEYAKKTLTGISTPNHSFKRVEIISWKSPHDIVPESSASCSEETVFTGVEPERERP